MPAASIQEMLPGTHHSPGVSNEAGEGKRGDEDAESISMSDVSDADLGLAERAVSAAGAAVISAIVVNPLDVAKTRLQAQAAGVTYNGVCRVAALEANTVIPDLSCIRSCTRTAPGNKPFCPPDCFQYKGTLDVFYHIIRQEGLLRLWRGTNASLALAVPTVGIYLPLYDIFRNNMEEFAKHNTPSLAPYSPFFAGSVARSLACISCYPIELARTRMQAFKETQTGKKPPGVWKTLIEMLAPLKKNTNFRSLQNYRILWTGLGAQLARDVPFSGICWSTLEPIRRRVFGLMTDKTSAANVFGANFGAGFIAGSLAAAATCPLDVVKTRRQIEKDPSRALRMTTRLTLAEIWRDGGLKGMFTGVGPRVARAGPSVGIVVSFYEVMKYCLHHM